MLDASAGVELLRGSESGRIVAELFADETETFHVPHLFSVEVTQVLRKLVGNGAVTPSRAGEAVADLAALDLIRHDHEPLLDRVWSLRETITAYDGVYVALAEALAAPLMTTDGRLAAAVAGLVEVQLLPD